MVGVAQLVEHQVVALRVVGSSPITHPINIKRPLQRACCNDLFVFYGSVGLKCAHVPRLHNDDLARVTGQACFQLVGRAFKHPEGTIVHGQHIFYL